jgi:hypothetical protein
MKIGNFASKMVMVVESGFCKEIENLHILYLRVLKVYVSRTSVFEKCWKIKERTSVHL